MKNRIRRGFLTLAMLLIAHVSFAQLNGAFNYAQDGHIYFYLTNTLRYPITVNVAVRNFQTNEARADRITILNGRQFVFGPNAGWGWMQGEVFIVTYDNGRSVSWTCPQTDPAMANNIQNNYGNTGGLYGGNGGNYGNTNPGWAKPVKVSYVPQEGDYSFNDGMRMFFVHVLPKNGYKEVNIQHSSTIPGQGGWGSFILDNRGILSPHHVDNMASGLFEGYNKYQFDFGPNMSYLVFNGNKYYKATKLQEQVHNKNASEAMTRYIEARVGSSSSHSSSSSSSSSKEQHGTRMVKCKNPTCVNGYNRTPESTRNPSVSYPPYHHTGNYSCPYCDNSYQHYHSRCSSCLTSKGYVQESY